MENARFVPTPNELSVLRRCMLFSGVSDDELAALLGCLDPRSATYARDELVVRRGDKADELGIVVEGRVHIMDEDYWGNRNILAAVEPGNLFLEGFACVPDATSHVSVIATQDTCVLFIRPQRIISTCSNVCVFHARIENNFLAALARKNIGLTEKIGHITKRTIREKILSYLSAESLVQGSSAFDIPFDRQQLADYLSVERTALSANLAKLRDEGVIAFRKNHFELL